MYIKFYAKFYFILALFTCEKTMHHFTEKGDLGLCYFLLQYLYQARKVSGNVHVLEISIIPLFLQFSIRILELFRQCGKFLFFIL